MAAAQEKIAALEHSRLLDSGLIAQLRVQGGELRDQLRYIAYEVGHQSVLLGEKTFLSHGFDGMRIEPWKPQEPMLVSDPASVAKWVNIAAEVVRLLNVNVVREHFRGHIHFDVGLAGKGVAYGISESAIRDMTPELLENRIAPEIAKELVRLLKGGA